MPWDMHNNAHTNNKFFFIIKFLNVSIYVLLCQILDVIHHIIHVLIVLKISKDKTGHLYIPTLHTAWGFNLSASAILL